MQKTKEIIENIQKQLPEYCDDATLSDYINNELSKILTNQENQIKDVINRFENCAKIQREKINHPTKHSYESETYEHGAQMYENAINIVKKSF